MVAHRRVMLFALLLPITLIAACDKVPLLAPTGTVITLIPQATTVPLNSQISIVATVIENGVASGGTGTGTGTGTGSGTGAGGGSSTTTSRSGSGTPVQNGTVVTFTTTLGRIEPSEARTHNGEVTVQLITGGASGTATITAYSGGASAQITNLKVGTAAVKTVTVTSSPQTLGSSGGSVQVIASVTDEGGNPLPGVPVTFATDKGSVSPSTATTDSNGNAVATLTTTATAKVTATAGTVTSTAATVNVNPFGLSAFTASPTAAAAGTPINFTVTPGTGASISNVRINYGDGDSFSFGSIIGPQSVQHPYCSPGTYTATANVTDNAGGTGSISTSVVIGALPVTLTASGSQTVGSPMTFLVGGIGAAQVSGYQWTVAGTAAESGTFATSSPQFPRTFTSKGQKTVRVDVMGVSGCQIGTATTQVEIQ